MDSSDILGQDVFALMGLEDLPQDRKEQMLGDMTETIQNRIMLRILRRISLDDQEVLNTIAEDQKQIEEFLNVKVPDLDIITREEITLYKQEMATTSRLIRQLGQGKKPGPVKNDAEPGSLLIIDKKQADKDKRAINKTLKERGLPSISKGEYFEHLTINVAGESQEVAGKEEDGLVEWIVTDGTINEQDVGSIKFSWLAGSIGCDPDMLKITREQLANIKESARQEGITKPKDIILLTKNWVVAQALKQLG